MLQNSPILMPAPQTLQGLRIPLTHDSIQALLARNRLRIALFLKIPLEKNQKFMGNLLTSIL